MDEVRGVIGCPAQGKGWAGKNARDQLERLVILTARGVRGHSLNVCPKSIPSRRSDEVTMMCTMILRGYYGLVPPKRTVGRLAVRQFLSPVTRRSGDTKDQPNCTG